MKENRVKVKSTPRTNSLCITDRLGYVEREKGDSVFVVVIDLDGGLCGPFELPKDAIESSD